MRRALRPLLPALAATYGVLPWHLADMPAAELAEFVADLTEMAEAREAAR